MQIGKYKLCFAFDHIAALLQTLISKIPRAKMDWLDWCRIRLTVYYKLGVLVQDTQKLL